MELGAKSRADEEQTMPKQTSVTLPDRLATFVEDQVAHGRYGSASDVVQAGLRLLEEYEMKVEALREALIEGEQSGAPVPFDFDAFIERKRNESTGR
jgi:antitoxin ParD1/3/4